MNKLALSLIIALILSVGGNYFVYWFEEAKTYDFDEVREKYNDVTFQEDIA